MIYSNLLILEYTRVMRMSTLFVVGVESPILLPELLPALCQDDRACELMCPEFAIDVMDRPSGERAWCLLPGLCTGCGLCIAACPEHALAGRPPGDRHPKRIMVTLT